MGLVAAGAVLIALLLIIAAAMVWQGSRNAPSQMAAVYIVDEAAAYVCPRLSDRALDRLDIDDVRRILELCVFYHQVEAASDAAPQVLASGDSIEFVMEASAEERGEAYDPIDIAEIIALDTGYLVEIGAVGEPVEHQEEMT
ncbi:hypothetical protein HQ535_07575 [bacterium]|nr:hypothetical protein [bacterium]